MKPGTSVKDACPETCSCGADGMSICDPTKTTVAPATVAPENVAGVNAVELTGSEGPNNTWWIVLVVIFGFVILLGVLLCAFSNQITSGQCGPWMQKNLTRAPPPHRLPRRRAHASHHRQFPAPADSNPAIVMLYRPKELAFKTVTVEPDVAAAAPASPAPAAAPAPAAEGARPGAAWLASQEAAEAAPATDERV